MWQDIVMTIILISFSYALIPQVYQGFRNKKGNINPQTSTITAIGMYSLAIIYSTLGLYLSVVISEITAILWSILLFQKLIYN